MLVSGIGGRRRRRSLRRFSCRLVSLEQRIGDATAKRRLQNVVDAKFQIWFVHIIVEQLLIVLRWRRLRILARRHTAGRRQLDHVTSQRRRDLRDGIQVRMDATEIRTFRRLRASILDCTPFFLQIAADTNVRPKADFRRIVANRTAGVGSHRIAERVIAYFWTNIQTARGRHKIHLVFHQFFGIDLRFAQELLLHSRRTGSHDVRQRFAVIQLTDGCGSGSGGGRRSISHCILITIAGRHSFVHTFHITAGQIFAAPIHVSLAAVHLAAHRQLTVIAAVAALIAVGLLLETVRLIRGHRTRSCIAHVVHHIRAEQFCVASLLLQLLLLMVHITN